ncbi:BKACE family enzyme [Tindallia californiensis]|uniref:Uncharacterized conserved protein, DUF849 family n=1 Tax=Tindallia californiensis TaxID=159292 RepID=A0A1H3PX94_9FIRM|nr:3-keto-5-aminohexanoate cleavage protein [Tindallia californiensis]SDZ05009.1 Uncharacterized conserved protein, DUF849 family [Tindallia californiensis]
MTEAINLKNKVMLTCAVTGAGDTTKINPYVPVTPAEIASSALAAGKAGAAVVHIHARDPKTGGISHDVEQYREILQRIREADPELIINITSGGGGDFDPDEENPYQAGKNSDLQTAEERHEPIATLAPEMCTLDCGSLNFGDMVYISPTEWLRKQAALIQKSGAKAELECFDTGHLRFANQLIKEGFIDGNPHFQFCLGIPWGAAADTETMLYLRNRIPEKATWSAFGIGAMQMKILAQAALLGGHVRVGLEDNLYLSKGVLAKNETLVEKGIDILQQLGKEPMTPQEAKALLQLK